MQRLFPKEPVVKPTNAWIVLLRWICFSAAIGCFTWCGLVWWEQRVHQDVDGELFEDSVGQGKESRGAPKEKIQGPIATLQIERLKVSGYVEEGFDSKTLRNAIGHAPHSARPGEKGNIVLAAHRDTFFAGLRDAKMGDRITLRARNGRKYGYKITRIFVVDPSASWVMKSSPDRTMLTLITCYPFRFVGSAPKRFIVQAQPVGRWNINSVLAQVSPRRRR